MGHRRVDPTVRRGRDERQDHHVLSDLPWNVFRNHSIPEYEILKYDGGLGRGNLFIPLFGQLCVLEKSSCC
jgi:hypothetical protein